MGSAGPLNLDGINSGGGAETEMEAQVILRKIAAAAANF
jgi:hypothetical protein